MNFLIKWETWEKSLKVIAVLIIIGIGIVEFIEFKYIQESLQWDAQQFHNWTMPVLTFFGTIALIFTLKLNIDNLRAGKADYYFRYYESEIDSINSGDERNLANSPKLLSSLIFSSMVSEH
jgi:hypothetical protein